MQSFKNIGKTILVKANKGGVGKSWITLQLAHKAAIDGNKVIIITSDSQNNILDFSGCGSLTPLGLDEWLTGGNGGFTELRKNLYYIPFNSAMLPEELEVRFESFVNVLKEEFDYVLIDCPPSLNLITINALVASNSVIIPLQCEFLALEGLTDLVKNINQIKKVFNPELKVQGIVLTMFDKRNNLSSMVEKDVRNYFGDLVYQTVIPRSVRISEAPSHGKPILIYDFKSVGAQAYISLAKEVLKREKEI